MSISNMYTLRKAPIRTMEFPPVEVLLPNGVPLRIEALSEETPELEVAARSFLTVEADGYKSIYGDNPFDPRNPDQVAEIVAIARREYNRSKVRNQLLIQGSVTIDQAICVAGIANVIYGGVVCNLPTGNRGGEAYTVKLFELHVRSDFRNQKIGSAMLRAVALAAAASYNHQATLMLEASVYNDRARDWYERCGITLTGHYGYHTWPNGMQFPAEERSTNIHDLTHRMG